MKRNGLLADDEFFLAEQNAKAIKNAEEYYRSMFHGRRSRNLSIRSLMALAKLLSLITGNKKNHQLMKTDGSGEDPKLTRSQFI